MFTCSLKTLFYNNRASWTYWVACASPVQQTPLQAFRALATQSLHWHRFTAIQGAILGLLFSFSVRFMLLSDFHHAMTPASVLGTERPLSPSAAGLDNIGARAQAGQRLC